MLSRKRISARDRRLAAVHEAGHVIMARHVGMAATSAWLEELPGSGLYEKLWVGHTRYMSPTNLKTISQKTLAMFAVAGAVAECCWKRDSFDEDTWYDFDSMSATDWAGCGCEPGDPTDQTLDTIKVVFSLFDREVGKLWPTLSFEARRLILDSRETRVANPPDAAV